MEKDPNPMPMFELFPRLTRAGRVILRLATPFPAEAPPYMSNHYRGAAAMLDRELYDKDQLQLDFEAQATEGW